MYRDTCTLTSDNVMHVLNAAKKYELSTLVKFCIAFLDKETTASNLCSILEHTLFFKVKELQALCLKKLELHSYNCLFSQDFLSVSKDTLSFILDQENLSMQEVDIFEACCCWAKSKFGDVPISEALGELFYKIRIPTMTSKYYLEVVCKKMNIADEEQLKMLRYMISPQKAEIPPKFDCRPRYSAGEYPIIKLMKIK